MSVKTNIKDFYGRVIGTVVEENNGDKTIKIGVLGPYSGDVAQYGLAVRNGAKLYVKQFIRKQLHGKQFIWRKFFWYYDR